MKAKFFAATMAFSIMAGQIAPCVSFPLANAATAETTTVNTGDVNANGELDSSDLLFLQTYLMTSSGITSATWQNADMNNDGTLNVIDLLTLRRWHMEKQACSYLYINEVCSSNKDSIKDAAGESPDWIEIYNSSESAVDLSGIGVSDGSKNKFKFTFPEGTVIPADGYVLVFCDDAVNEAQGEYHAAFKISASGETIYLTHPRVGEIDSVTVPVLDTDMAYGCYPDGTAEFTYLSPTPRATNNTATDLEVVEMPVFSAEGGFYDSAFSLGLSDVNGNEIIYTTDGSDPRTSDTAKTYSSRISIYNNTNDANVYSAITDITLNDYRAPSYKVDKGIVIRAVCKNADGKYSKVVTNSYFVGKTASYYSDFKVVSLSTDSDYLFDEDTGIYMVGSEYYQKVQSGQFNPLGDTNDVANPTNYNKEGKETEIPMNVQVFENGELAYTSDVGARLSGNWSRGYAQKSIRLYARSEYGDSKMKYEFIEGLTDINGNPIEEYDKVTLRNGGTDNNLLHFRDLFIQELCADRAVDGQAGEPCIVFIDGEFWGFYFIREKQDADYIESHYGIDKDNVTTIKIEELDEGSQEVADEYQEFLYWAADADMSVAENYRRVCDTIDIQSFIDQVVIETYINNTDWATDYLNNWIVWRATEPDASNPYADGKWRFMLYDLDFSADYFEDARTYAGFDTLNNMYTGDAPYNFVPMFYNLLNNEEFSELFYNSYIDIMKNNFDPVEVSEKLDEYLAMYKEAITATNTRFDQEWVNERYNEQTEEFRQYFIDRRNLAKTYLDKLYGADMNMTAGSNIVSNASTWSYYGNASVSKSSSNNSITVTTNQLCANSWDIQTQSGQLKIEKGKTYTITFQASCTTGSPIAVSINHQVSNSWPSCFSKSGIELTSSLQEFSYTFVSTHDTASNWRLCIDFGNGVGVYTIKNPTVAQVTYDTELVNELGEWRNYNPSGEGTLTSDSVDSFTINTSALPNEDWENQAYFCGMVLDAGKTYTCSFTIKSDNNSTVGVYVQQNFGNHNQFLSKNIATTSTPTTYTYTFTTGESCIDASLCFNCGGALGTVEVTDISLTCRN